MPPQNAIDGDSSPVNIYTDKWASLLLGPKWLQVDFGSTKTLDHIVIKHAGAGGETTAFNTSAFTIKVSQDGVNWTTVDSVVGNTASVTSHLANGVAARYVRLDITKPTQTNNTAARIYELEAWGFGAAQTNLALYGTASASASFAPTSPSDAIDGQAVNVYTDKWCSLAANKWVQVDLGSIKILDHIVIKHAGVAENPAYNTSAFAIRVSINGSTWTTVDSVVGNTASITSHPANGVTARFINLNITKSTQANNTAARIYELEVWGSNP
jgi:hypothetical protein